MPKSNKGISYYPADKLLGSDIVNPQLFRVDYSMRRYFVDEFFFRYVTMLPTQSQILDVGGHRDKKRGQFDMNRYSFPTTYLNLTTDKGTDVQGNAAYLPFPTGYFDVVICAEVLEHTLNPYPILCEIYRVLKPQGQVLITVPFIYRIHADPYDFGRYTDYYWQHNLGEIGFRRIEIEKQGLFWSVLFDMVRDQIYQRNWIQTRWRRWIVYMLVRLRRRALRWDSSLQLEEHPTLTGYTTGFGIVAQK
jgi:SAM-dependent methyltransferase